jgi:hypothetical protein
MSAPFISNSFSTPSPIIPTHTINPINSPTVDNTQNINFPLVSTQIAPIPVPMQFSDVTPDVKAQVSSPELKYGYLYEEVVKQQIFLPNENTLNLKEENYDSSDSYSYNADSALILCIMIICILCILFQSL